MSAFIWADFKLWFYARIQSIMETALICEIGEDPIPPRASVRFRAEGHRALGEAIAWQTGETSLVLYDLNSGAPVIDVHHLVMIGSDWSIVENFLSTLVKLEEMREE